MRNAKKKIENDSKIIENQNYLIDIFKERFSILHEELEDVKEELDLIESREWVLFEFIEKNGHDIVDVYEFINEKIAFGSQEFKKMILDDLMRSHKKFKDEKNK